MQTDLENRKRTNQSMKLHILKINIIKKKRGGKRKRMTNKKKLQTLDKNEMPSFMKREN